MHREVTETAKFKAYMKWSLVVISSETVSKISNMIYSFAGGLIRFLNRYEPSSHYDIVRYVQCSRNLHQGRGEGVGRSD